MAVTTAQAAGRRALRYGSSDELLADEERLARPPIRAMGNWSQAQIYKHLAMSLDASINGTSFAIPAPIRWLMSRLMKKKVSHGVLSAAYKAPCQ